MEIVVLLSSNKMARTKKGFFQKRKNEIPLWEKMFQICKQIVDETKV